MVYFIEAGETRYAYDPVGNLIRPSGCSTPCRSQSDSVDVRLRAVGPTWRMFPVVPLVRRWNHRRLP